MEEMIYQSHIYAGKDGDVNVMYDFNDGSEYGIYDLLSIGQSKKACNDILYALDTGWNHWH